MMTSTLNSAWQPLGWLAWAALYAAAGLRPWAYHAASLALHAGSTALVFALGCELLEGCVPASAAAALLFALHPLQVESVAWASCLADLLCCLLVLASLLAHVRRRDGLAITLAAAAALARWEVVAILPLVLVIDRLALKRPWSWRVLSLLLLIETLAAGANAVAKASVMRYHSAPPAPGVAAAAALELLARAAVPVALRPVYLVTPDSRPFGFTPGQALLFLAALTALLFVLRKKAPAAWAAWLCWLAAFTPVVSLSRPGPVFVHDRYAYLGLAAFALAAGAAIKKAPRLLPAAGVLIVAFCVASVGRISAWRDAEALWKSVVAVDPQESLAYFDLGNIYLAQGRYYEAIYYLREQARRNPEKGNKNLAHAWNDLGVHYAQRGELLKARQSLERARALGEGDPQVLENLDAVARALRRAPGARR